MKTDVSVGTPSPCGREGASARVRAVRYPRATMRLPGRLSAAIEVLTDVETRHRPVSEGAEGVGAQQPFRGAGDRAAIGNRL